MDTVAEPPIVEPLAENAPERDKGHVLTHPELGLSEKEAVPHIAIVKGVFENGRPRDLVLSKVATIGKVAGKWPRHHNLPFKLSGHLPDEARETPQKDTCPLVIQVGRSLQVALAPIREMSILFKEKISQSHNYDHVIFMSLGRDLQATHLPRGFVKGGDFEGLLIFSIFTLYYY